MYVRYTRGGQDHSRLLTRHSEMTKDDWTVRVLQKATKKRAQVERFHEATQKIPLLIIAICSATTLTGAQFGIFQSSYFQIAFLDFSCLISSISLRWMICYLTFLPMEVRICLFVIISNPLQMKFGLSSSYPPHFALAPLEHQPQFYGCFYTFQHSSYLLLQIKESNISTALSKNNSK